MKWMRFCNIFLLSVVLSLLYGVSWSSLYAALIASCIAKLQIENKKHSDPTRTERPRASLLSHSPHILDLYIKDIGLYIWTTQEGCMRPLNTYIPDSQLTPVYPDTQVHVYLFSKLLQVAPFWQGELLHSSISVKNEVIENS